MNKSPKVLHVIRSEAFGGLELYVNTLIGKLKYCDVKMAVYCMPNSILAGKFIENGIPTIDAKKNTKYYFQDILQIRSLVIKENYTVVHSHTNVDAVTCALAMMGLNNCKHVFSLYMSTIAKRDFFHWLIYKKIDILLSTSETINANVKHNYPIDEKKIKLLRYGRDVDAYNMDTVKRNTLRNKWNSNENKIIIGTMCRIDPTKGVKELAESFLYLPEYIKERVVFWIIGERTILYKKDNQLVFENESDELYQWLIDFIAHNHLESRILLIPFQKDLQGYLSAMDIFVLASYNEMYALAVLDALLMKLPVIGTKTGGTPEQLANNRGMTISPKSPQEIASAIEYIIDNPEKAISMGNDGREWVLKEHDWQYILPQYLALYHGN